MKAIHILSILTILSCGEKRRAAEKKVSVKNDSLSSASFSKNTLKDWKNNEMAFIKVDSLVSNIKNISYTEEFLNRDNNLDHYIAKRTQETVSTLGNIQHESKITLDFFSRENGELIWSTNKSADDISILTDFIHTTRYGCCGAEDYHELRSLWTDEAFLTFNSKYYQIDIPNAHTSFYFGYLADAREEDKLIHGILFFAQELPYLPNEKDTYSSIFKIANTVVFKMKTKESFDKIVPFSPDISMVKHGEDDRIIEYQNHQKLELWAYENAKGLKGLDFIGLKMIFTGEKNIEIEIPIKDGFLFGENSIHRTIFIGE